MLFKQVHIGHRHASVHCLAHVIDGLFSVLFKLCSDTFVEIFIPFLSGLAIPLLFCNGTNLGRPQFLV